MTDLRKRGGVDGRRPFRSLLGFVAIVLLSAPLSLLATLLLLPLWLWLESAGGIEAVGHSGPAAWCYLLVFAILAGAATVALFVRLGGAKLRLGR